MKEARIETATAAVSEEELAEIALYARRALKPEEIYTFRLILCDNEIDRDWECFTPETLQSLAGLFAGKTGIFDHDARGENQTARIYRCWVEKDETRTTTVGEPYQALKAKAYMVRTSANADLILEIDAGIKKEVSVGCAVESTTCSICGADRRKNPCAHQPGKRYGKALCYTLLSEPSDAYEWSFVAVPSQRNAGVTKAHGSMKAMNLTPERAIHAMEQGELHLDAASAAGLRKHISYLERQGEAATHYRETLCTDIRRCLMMAQPELNPTLLEKTLLPLSTPELEELRTLSQKSMDQRFPPLVQTAPETNAAPTGNEHFKI